MKKKGRKLFPLLIVVSLILLISFIPLVSAALFDNIKDYFKNLFGYKSGNQNIEGEIGELGSLKGTGSGLVAHWQFEDNYLDSALNHHGNPIGNPQFTNGRFGKAIKLDGIDDHVNVSLSEQLYNTGQGMTMSAWIKHEALVKPRESIIFQGTFTQLPYSKHVETDYELYFSRGDIFFLLGEFGDNSSGGLFTKSVVNDSQWHLITTVIKRIDPNKTNRYIYIDGVLKSSGPDFNNTEVSDNPTDQSIGGVNNPNLINHFNGSIDDVRIYNRALSESEILELYNEVQCTPKCSGRNCGDNWCGGVCGVCPQNQICNTQGICQTKTGSNDYYIRCSSNTQCGMQINSSNYCLGNNVYKNVTNPVCNNPGTVSSSCIRSNSSTLIQTCPNDVNSSNYCRANYPSTVYYNLTDYGCSAGSCTSNILTNLVKQTCSSGKTCLGGSCVSIICSSNSQCGSQINSSNFCSGNNVYKNVTNPVCNNSGLPSSFCSNSTSQNLIQTCPSDLNSSNFCKTANLSVVYYNITDYGCSAGSCVLNIFTNLIKQVCSSGNICSNGACINTPSNLNLTISIATLKDSYQVGEKINLTDPPDEDINNIVRSDNINQESLNYTEERSFVFFDADGNQKILTKQVNQNTSVFDYSDFDIPQFKEGEVIIKFKEDIDIRKKGIVERIGISAMSLFGVKSSLIKTDDSSINEVFEKHKAENFEKLFDISTKSKSITGNSILTQENVINELSKIAVIKTDNTINTIKDFEGLVEYAEPNYLVKIDYTPNDPMYPKMWPLNNIGQDYLYSKNSDGTPRFKLPPGTIDADIDAPEAWDIEKGSEEIVVAVVDTGVYYNHEDLRENIWTNKDEIPNNRLDDDDNGYVDDFYGWDFVNNDANPTDDYGHGTHVAGTISAVTNNNIGVTGVCNNCKIMSLKFLDSEGSGDIVNGIKSWEYAIENGAKVISNSWGGGGYSQTAQDVANLAAENGIVMIAAAGNNNNDKLHYPSGYNNIISVAATDSDDKKATFSTYGESVDVAAPGVDILSTVPNVGQISDPTGYKVISGTSMATPHVAGLAGLISSKNPNLTTGEVTGAIKNAVDAYNSSKYIGTGRINANKALNIQSFCTVSIISPIIDSEVNSSIEIIGRANCRNASDFVKYELYYGENNGSQILWAKFKQSNSPVNNGKLGEFDTYNLSIGKGKFYLKIRVENKEGFFYEDILSLKVKNLDITYPLKRDSFRSGDIVEIRGTINSSDISSYDIEVYIPSYPVGNWTKNGVSLVNESNPPVANDVLGYWDTTGLSEVIYDTFKIKLKVTRNDGRESYVIKDGIFINRYIKEGFPVKIYPNINFDETSSLFRGTLGVSDLNNDGLKEIIVLINGNPGRVFIYNSDGTLYNDNEIQINPIEIPVVDFNQEEGVTFVEFHFNPVFMDIDSDGRKELIFNAWHTFEGFITLSTQIYVYNDDGSPLSNFNFKKSGNFRHLLVYDLDGDSIPEIIANGDFYNGTYIYNINGSLIALGKSEFIGSYWIEAGRQAIGNLDDDSDYEVVVSRPPNKDNDILIHAYNIDGSEVDGWPINLSEYGDYQSWGIISLADFDSDGKDEIVVPGDIDDKVLFLFDNDGTIYSGNWPKEINGTWSFGEIEPSIADVDKDGNLDIVVGSIFTNVRIFNSNGEDFIKIYYPSASKNTVLLSDVNNDGKIELVDNSRGTYGLSQGFISMYKPGGFNSLYDLIISGTISSSPIINDLDADGFTELINLKYQSFFPTGEEITNNNPLSILVWELNTTLNKENSPWPMFRHDEMNTANYGTTLNLTRNNILQCNDILDNDQDGLIDYPNDPGCENADDNNETNIISTNRPQSKIVNNMNSPVTGTLNLSLQKKVNNVWLVQKNVFSGNVTIPANGLIKLDIGGNYGWNLQNVNATTSGEYRVYASFKKDNNIVENSWNFSVV